MKEDAVDRWVRDLNAMAHKLDETARSVHPSAWSDILGVDNERWQRLAEAGPKGKVNSK